MRQQILKINQREQVNRFPIGEDMVDPLEIRNDSTIGAHIVDSDGTRTEVKLWRISPIGIEFVNPGTITGDKKDLSILIRIGTSNTLYDTAIVRSNYTEYGQPLIAVRFVATPYNRKENEENRSTNRWALPQSFAPSGISPIPTRFNEYMHFNVEDISSGGMKFSTSLRNKLLFKGMRFKSHIYFPLFGSAQVDFEIMHVNISEDSSSDRFFVGAKFLNLSSNANMIISNYILQFCKDSSPSMLREAGFSIRNINTSVRFSYAKSKSDLEDVLKLRHIAYSSADKIDSSGDYRDRGDELDSRSRIVVGKHNNQIVASCRIIFSNGYDRLEQEKFVTWPENLPHREEMAEITRACVHPDFWRTDVLLEMSKFVALEIVQSDRKYILICASEEMVPLYLKMGYKHTGLSYEHSSLKNIKHWVMIGDVKKGMCGKGINPIYWNLFWGEVAEHMLRNGLFSAQPSDILRFHFYKLFQGPAKIFLKLLSRKRAKKK